jgi:bifunctional non-homologous end joining protein LigD
LVKSKWDGKYRPGLDAGSYEHLAGDKVDTGVRPQLLNFIEEAEVERYIEDDDYWAQQKHDGERRLLLKKDNEITATNKKGEAIGGAVTILESVRAAKANLLVDGEDMGAKLHAFDLLELHGDDLRPWTYFNRLLALENIEFGAAVEVVYTAKTTKEKRTLLNRLICAEAEGIVFKRYNAPYTAGKPNSGGDQVKFKFYETATLRVFKVNEKSSVGMSLFENDSEISVGNVTIPPNASCPEVGDFIEVRYLYAYKGGSLFQPTFLGIRTDVDQSDCQLSQLKYKKTE